MFGVLTAFALYFLGGLITYCGVYACRVLKYKKSGMTHLNCDQYIRFNCEDDEFDLFMYVFWPVTITISFVILVFTLAFKHISAISGGIKTLIKKLLKLE